MLARAEQVKLLVLGKKSDQAGKKFAALLALRCNAVMQDLIFFVITPFTSSKNMSVAESSNL